MLTSLTLLVLLHVPTTLAADVLITKDEMTQRKHDYKDEKKRHAEVRKIAKQWTAAAAKKKLPAMHKVDTRLVAWRRGALEDLRQAGVKTKGAGLEGDAPLREAYRDLLVELRESQARFDDETAGPKLMARKAELLELLELEAHKRMARRKTRVDLAKEALRNQR